MGCTGGWALGLNGTIIFWIQRVNRSVCYAGMLLIVPLMLLTSADVIGRAALARPIPGIVELSSYMLDVFILLGLAYTQQVKGHVRVSMLTSRLPQRAQQSLEIVSDTSQSIHHGAIGVAGLGRGDGGNCRFRHAEDTAAPF